MNSVPLALCIGIGAAAISVLAVVLYPEQPDPMVRSIPFSVLWTVLLLVMSGRVR